MRRAIQATIVTGVLWLFAGAAMALPASPSTIVFDTTKRSGSINLLASGENEIRFDVELTRGKLSKVTVMVLAAAGSSVRGIEDAGEISDMVKKIKIKEKRDLTMVQFSLKKFKIHKKDTATTLRTNPLFIHFDDLALGDVTSFTLQGGGPASTLAATIIPEPGTLLLLAAGLGGLGWSARRRR